METIDVLFAVTTLGPGGTEAYVQDLAIALKDQGLRIAVVVDSEPMLRLASLEAMGITVHRLGIEGSCPRREYAARIDRILSRCSVRLIHANMWIRERWLRDIAHTRGIPFVITCHQTIPRIRMRDRLGLNRIPFEIYRNRRILARGNSGTICISDAGLANYRSRYGFRVRAVRVYCGRPERATQADPSRGGTSPKIVWIGSMTARKRPLLAIQAVQTLLSKFPDCTLVMAGEGELISRTREEALKLGGRVTLPGYVRNPNEYLTDADILLHTAANEGTPLVVLEAMAAGLPVVATNAGAANELVADGVTGLLVPVDNQPAIADALAKFASNPKLRDQYGKAARHVFQERFTHARMIDDTLSAYEHLVGVAVLARQGVRSHGGRY